MSLTERVFDLVFEPWMASRVRVHVAGMPDYVMEGVPYLYCANHESWWDGFLVRALHRRLRPGAPFRAVMLERELRDRPLLRSLGALGLDPGSVASGRRLLRSLAGLPADAGVAFFPQGRLRPGNPRPLGFRSGLNAVIRALSPVMVVPVGIRLVPGRSHRMDAFLSVGTPLPAPRAHPPTRGRVEAAVTEELDAIQAFLRRFEEDAAELWPSAAGVLPRGPQAPWLSTVTPLPFSEN